jgi:hypothetical protein
MAEIHLAALNRLFKQTEPALISTFRSRLPRRHYQKLALAKVNQWRNARQLRNAAPRSKRFKPRRMK